MNTQVNTGSLIWSARRLAVLAGVAVFYSVVLAQRGLWGPDVGSSLIYFRLFLHGEPLAAAFLVAWLLLVRPQLASRDSDLDDPQLIEEWWRSPYTYAGLLIGSLFMPVLVGTLSNDGVPIAMDEYGAWLQSQFLRQGQLVGHLPLEWVGLREAVTPVFVQGEQDSTEWVLTYLPGFSAMLATLGTSVSTRWLNPALNVVSLVAIWGVARRRWPGSAEQRILAVSILALSSQFLLGAATLYSMPAHLAFNMVWLWGYVGGPRRNLIMGPVGFVASLLHQPIPHPLFVAPFLIRLLRERKWTLLAYLSVWYGMAVAVFIGWTRLGGGASVAALGQPTLANAFVLVMHLVTMGTWQTPIAALLVGVRIYEWKSIDCFDRDLLSGVLLSLVFYLFFVLVTQGHGWGWRYGHQVLGNLSLLAASAWPIVQGAVGSKSSRFLVVSSFLVTCVAQIPHRTLIAVQFSRPFARSVRWLSTLQADIVIVPTDSVWYGRDLIRNTPDLRSPVMLHDSVVRRLGVTAIPHGDSLLIRRVSVDELEALGLERLHRPSTK